MEAEDGGVSVAAAAALGEEELAGASLEALVARFHAARRNAVLARARADYQDATNAHREAIQFERLLAAGDRMRQADAKAIVESNPEVLKGRQQSIVHAKDAALWQAEAEALRLYLSARTRTAGGGGTED